MRRSVLPFRLPFARLRHQLRSSEAALILLAALVGLLAGAATNVQSLIAHGMQQLFYGISVNRISALAEIRHPWRLLALPTGGLLLMLLRHALRRRRNRAPIDVVEANALHGGRIPMRDSLTVAAETVLSNGAGASVGLEAAYAQMGGGIASLLGRAFKLRRRDLRTLVGAGAGAAVGAAFGAPLAGTFYAFEIVLGTYSPATIAPVAAAALAATSVSRTLGAEPYLIAATTARVLTTADYLAYIVLGLAAALLGILVMRLVTWSEWGVQRLPVRESWRPVLGGLLLMPIAWMSPQALSAGHGALHLDLALHLSIGFLATILLLKILASVISLSFGFRGGLFFASLFLGSLLGQLYAGLVGLAFPGLALDWTDAALVGMAALSVSIVGGPMTLSLLILEATHDFALTGVVIVAGLVASAFTREHFGYSFSTWRLHVRGSAIKSPRDIGWMHGLSAGRLMRQDPVVLPEDMSIAAFREAVPLGATSRAILCGPDGGYRGIVDTAVVHAPHHDPMAPVGALATLVATTLGPEADIGTVLRGFDRAEADDLAVIDSAGRIVGVISEKYARRRYLEESEANHRALFGE